MNYYLVSDCLSRFEKTSKSFSFVDMRTKALDLVFFFFFFFIHKNQLMHFMPME